MLRGYVKWIGQKIEVCLAGFQVFTSAISFHCNFTGRVYPKRRLFTYIMRVKQKKKKIVERGWNKFAKLPDL